MSWRWRPTDHPGLVLAFELTALGRTDREVARSLNEAGYRTSGNRGAHAFTKVTVCAMLQNRFSLGELQTEDGTWIPGKHSPLID